MNSFTLKLVHVFWTFQFKNDHQLIINFLIHSHYGEKKINLSEMRTLIELALQVSVLVELFMIFSELFRTF